MLKKTVVPTIFDFPNHLLPKIKERRILQREVSKITYKYIFILLRSHLVCIRNFVFFSKLFV